MTYVYIDSALVHFLFTFSLPSLTGISPTSSSWWKNSYIICPYWTWIRNADKWMHTVSCNRSLPPGTNVGMEKDCSGAPSLNRDWERERVVILFHAAADTSSSDSGRHESLPGQCTFWVPSCRYAEGFSTSYMKFSFVGSMTAVEDGIRPSFTAGARNWKCLDSQHGIDWRKWAPLFAKQKHFTFWKTKKTVKLLTLSLRESESKSEKVAPTFL